MIGVSLHYLGDQTNARRHLERMLEPLCRPGAPVARHPLSIRPAGGGAHDPGADPLAAGISRSGPAHGPGQRRRRPGHRSCALAVLCAGGGVPGRALDRRSGGRRTLGGDAARPFGAACAGRLAGAGPLLRRGCCSSSAAMSPTDSSCCAPASTSSARRASSRTTRRCSAAGRRPGRRRAGRSGPATIDEALARSERDEERWCIAELLRIKGELPAGGRSERRGGGRGALPAGAQLGAPSRGRCPGAALRHQSCAALARTGPERARRVSCWPRVRAGSPRASTPPTWRPPGSCSAAVACRNHLRPSRRRRRARMPAEPSWRRHPGEGARPWRHRACCPRRSSSSSTTIRRAC